MDEFLVLNHSVFVLIVSLTLCEMVVIGLVVVLNQSILTSTLGDVPILLLAQFVVAIPLILLVGSVMDHHPVVLALIQPVLIVIAMV